jgi:hypothetical protein
MGGWNVNGNGLYKSDNIFISSDGTFSFTPESGIYCSFMSTGSSNYSFYVKGALASFSGTKGIQIGSTALSEATLKKLTNKTTFTITPDNGTKSYTFTLDNHLKSLYNMVLALYS